MAFFSNFEEMPFRRLDEEEELTTTNASETLRNTLRIYGSIFVVLLLIFCLVRTRYPKTYNVRNWSPKPKLLSPLAKNIHGFISWMWKNFDVSDDDLLDECGLDAICMLRILRFGLRVSLLGVFNSIWLMPIYATAPTSSETSHIDDAVTQVSATHVPASNYRLLATTLASYTIFGYAMYLILEDFKWFTKRRHTFLAAKSPENYSVYVTNISPEYRSDEALKNFFNKCFFDGAVYSANIARNIPNLEKKFLEREALVADIAHAYNVERIKGERPTMKKSLTSTEVVDSINAYNEKLEELNVEITEAIEKVERIAARDPSQHPSIEENGKGTKDEEEGFEKKGVTGSLKKMTSLLSGTEDGGARESGFVTFNKLSTTQAAVQMVHHETPFEIQGFEAPPPHDIFWANVGWTHKQLQVGKLVGLCLTALLCTFWTIPMSFVASISDVKGLTEALPFIEDWLEAAPVLEQILAQIAPLFVVILNAMLPTILMAIAKKEGPISASAIETSLFVKYAWFMVSITSRTVNFFNFAFDAAQPTAVHIIVSISFFFIAQIIQTFFVSAISGSIFKELSNIMDNPGSAVDLLANSLPGQAIYFVQILLVATSIGMGMELLRIAPIVIAFIRGKVGPNLTEKEQNMTWKGLRPLADPIEFLYGVTMGKSILYFMVTFVYSSMAPLTNFFLAACYALMSSVYRHQFIYCYPPTRDSGGKLWTGFIGIVITCMMIAEIVVTGWLGIKKAPVAAGLMIPLIVCTFLFSCYVRQEHFHVTDHLPTKTCVKIDDENCVDGHNELDFATDEYGQPALKEKNVQPDIEGELDTTRVPMEVETTSMPVAGSGDEIEIQSPMT